MESKRHIKWNFINIYQDIFHNCGLHQSHNINRMKVVKPYN